MDTGNRPSPSPLLVLSSPHAVSGQTCVFHTVSRRILARWVLARWLALLGRTSPVVFTAAIAFCLAQRLLDRSEVGLLPSAALAGVWLMGAGVWSFLARPSPIQAMADWDERGRHCEMFVSAYSFESRERLEEGEQLHVAVARARLPEALARLRRDLPLPVPHAAWMFPLLFVAVLESNVLKVSVAPEDMPLGEDAVRRAQEAGEALKDRARVLQQAKGLTPDEQKKLDQLKASMEQTSHHLREVTDKTPKEILEELEGRAREAEKLAKELEGDAENALASPMITELERHADTAELAAGLRANAYDQIADEADKLGERLRDSHLALETQERIGNALGKSLKAASEPDKRSAAGRHIRDADRNLDRKAPADAAEDFARLAQHYRQASQRERARRQLDHLAKHLRQAGQKVLGSRSGPMQQLAQAQSVPLTSAGQQMTRVPLILPGQLFRQGTSVPGHHGAGQLLAGQSPGNSPNGAWSSAIPIPGTGPRPSMLPGGMSNTPVPGTSSMPGSWPGQCAGQTPVPGSGQGVGQAAGLASSQGAGQGGLYAGRGAAAYTPTQTVPLQTSSTNVVSARMGTEGESLLRNIEGQSHAEEGTRSSRQLAIQFIRSEEEALNEEPIPLTRREQVLRYFQELRRQLEQ